MLRPALTILKKEILQELRTKYAINTILAFTGAALLLVLFTLRADQLDPTPRSGLVWIIILFAAMTGMMRSFVQETEKKTWNLLQLNTYPSEVYWGKFSYNFLFLLLLHLFTFLFYMIMMNLTVVSPGYFIASILFGAGGLASVTTLTSAMIAQADRKGAVFSVLCIPLLVPLLMILTQTTRAALIEGGEGADINDLFALVGYCGVTISAGVLLFDYIWDE
ncbi:MAG: heme exporter protein CcmB [Balneolaceae bacterium]|nr:heme exporter protein CcmB [Balneolaceae bacterium]MCH8549226.1 heme exporter protein CcmB [Balneolaceae bacterium]